HAEVQLDPGHRIPDRSELPRLVAGDDLPALLRCELRGVSRRVVARRPLEHRLESIPAIPVDPALESAVVYAHGVADLADPLALVQQEQRLQPLAQALVSFAREPLGQLLGRMCPLDLEGSASHAVRAPAAY